VGICGSDVHFWRHGRLGRFVVTSPLVLGHECSGEVAEVGPDVPRLRVGDRVAIEPGIPCRMCQVCATGAYNLCPDVRFLAAPPQDGALQELLVHRADCVHQLPPEATFEEGALLEPLSVAIHAVRRGRVDLGSGVAVLGSGPVGLMCVVAARMAGAARIVVIDPDLRRLDVAQSLGADAVFTSSAQASEPGAGGAPEIVLECSGSAEAAAAAISLVRPGGTVVITGVGPIDATLPLAEMSMKEIDVRGHFRYANTWPVAISLLDRLRPQLATLVTHRFPLEEAEQAFVQAATRRDGSIKTMVTLAG
jgi:L-iditol 2-dehydrogenase